MSETIEAFRRLCVAYGEARAKYAWTSSAEDRREWRKDCDSLWKKIEEVEQRINGRRAC